MDNFSPYFMLKLCNLYDDNQFKSVTGGWGNKIRDN